MNIESAKGVIRACRVADDALIMEGLHGVGKSAAPKQIAKEDELHLEELFLSHQEVGDIIGIPHTIEIENADGIQETITTWSKPIWLQRMEKNAANGIHSMLFLDELNRAPIDVRQSALQLVLERKIHEHSLPVVDGKRTIVVAAINPADGYQVDELDPALLDRFLHINIDVDAPAWLSWARKEGVNPIVRDFIAEHNDRLHWSPAEGSVNNNEGSESVIGATPRSWTKLADFMDNVDSIPEDVLFQVMKGKVGTELGSQFYSFFKDHSNIIKVVDIEDLVDDHSDEVGSIEEMAEIIADKIDRTEAIQKMELAHQLADKYGSRKNILPFHAFLYALPIEVCVAFLKGMKKDTPVEYKNLARIDTELNDKKLFKRIVIASDKTE